MKNYSFFLKACFILAVYLLISCGNDNAKKNTATPESDIKSTTSETTATQLETDDQNYYAWVDNINVRDASSTKGNVIGTYTSDDALTFTGTKSDTKDVIVLRGVAYDDYWLNVNTKDGKTGWVFAGAVKKQGEEKGNAMITDTKFNFPYFGTYDLSTWKDLGIRTEEGGDVEIRTISYFKNGQTLEISKTSIGEYGYNHTYVLKDNNKNISKERKFEFSVELQDDNSSKMILTETVKDYKANKMYMRQQPIRKHFMQLNPRPKMVSGAWTTSSIKTPKSDAEN